MTHDAPATTIERFLGAEAASGGPLELLGLARDRLTEAAVLEARDRRIRELDAHPHAETPEADEVRLALHAAAVNLLDPRVRALLGTAPATARPPEPSPPPPPQQPIPNAHAFERDALVTIGMHGGWSAAARRHLMLVAHFHGVTGPALSTVLSRLTHPRPNARRAPTRPIEPQTLGQRLAMDPVPEAEPIDDVWRIAAAVGVALVVSAIILTTLVLVIVNSGPEGRADPAPVASDAAPPAPAAVAQTPAGLYVPERREDLAHASVIAHELASATAALSEGHADADARFAAGVRQLATTWTSLRVADVSNANAQALAYVIAADARGVRQVEVIRTVGRGDPDTRPALSARVWASGMLAAIAGNQNVHTGTVARARDAMGDLGVPDHADSFRTGARGALRELIRVLPARPEEPWIAWSETLPALGIDQSDAGNDLTLRALARQLRDPDAPSEELLTALVARTTWRDASPARPWLLTQFTAADVNSDRLSALLRVLARTSSAAGVATDMVIEPHASPAERAAMRDRYAQAWGLLDREGTSDELSAALAGVLADTVAVSRTPGTDLDRMRVLAELTRVNAIAARLAAGDPVNAAEELQSGVTRVEDTIAIQPGESDPLSDVPAGDGSWGAEALQAEQDTSERLISRLEARAEDSSAVGPADGGVLARLAFRGTGADVRLAASTTLAAHRESPHLIMAVLDMLDSIPRNETNARTIEAVTGRVVWSESRDEFYVRARRALLARLLDVIAVGTEEATLDRVAGLIDGYYAWAYDGQTVVAGAPPAYASAAALQARLGSRVRTTPAVSGAGLDPGSIERRWASRRSLASGPISRLAAEQRALAETLAAEVLERSPGQVTRVDAVLRVLEREDAGARDALDQALSAERAIAVLWQLLLTEGV